MKFQRDSRGRGRSKEKQESTSGQAQLIYQFAFCENRQTCDGLIIIDWPPRGLLVPDVSVCVMDGPVFFKWIINILSRINRRRNWGHARLTAEEEEDERRVFMDRVTRRADPFKTHSTFD